MNIIAQNNLTSSSSSTTASSFDPKYLIAYLSLAIVGLGSLGNTISFLVFRLHRSFRKMPSMVYLSFVAVTDTLALCGWNLNHYSHLVFGFEMMFSTLGMCRFFNFIQYTSMQISALLLSIVCVDRYVTVMVMPGSFLHKLPFRTLKTSYGWSIGVVLFCVILNFHVLFTAGIIENVSNSTDTRVNCYVFITGVPITIWDQIDLFIYNSIPFAIMIVFNTLLIVNLRQKIRNPTTKSKISTGTVPLRSLRSSRKIVAPKLPKRRPSLTVSLITLSFLFVFMTTPGTIMFSFFYSEISDNLSTPVVFLIDDISFIYHASLFLITFMSYKKFRRAIIEVFCGKQEFTTTRNLPV